MKTNSSVHRQTQEYKQALSLMRRKVPDLERVYDLLVNAMKKGDPQAVYAVATWYLHGKHVKKNTKQAVSLLAKAAAAGVADATFDLAVSYEKGIGVRRSERRAAQLYLKAALLGDAMSGFEVGRCLFHGIGFSRDRVQAKVWLDHYEDSDANHRVRDVRS